MAVENEHERSPGSDVACGKTLFTTHLAGHLSCAASRAMSGQPGPVRHNGSVRLVGLVGPVQSGPVRCVRRPPPARPRLRKWHAKPLPPFVRMVTRPRSRMFGHACPCGYLRVLPTGPAPQVRRFRATLPCLLPSLPQARSGRLRQKVWACHGPHRRRPAPPGASTSLFRLAALPTRTHAPAYQDTRAASSRTRWYTEWVEAATASQANLESASSRPRCEMKLRKPGSESTRLIPQASESALPE